MRKLIFALIIGLFAGLIIGLTAIGPYLDKSSNVSGKKGNIGKISQSSLNYNKESEIEGSDRSLPNVKKILIASHFPVKNSIPGILAKRFEKTISRNSERRFEVIIKEPGTLIQSSDIFRAVQSGTIQAGFSSPLNWVAQIPALQLFSSIPFGIYPREFLAWLYNGGGKKIYSSLYRKRNIHAIICGISTSQNYNWFRRNINDFNDFKRLKIVATGLTEKIIKKLGIKTKNESGIDLLNAIESGAVDGVFYSEDLGQIKDKIHDIAKFYYFPEWHSPVKLFDLIINSSTWATLSRSQKSQIKSACADNVLFGLTLSDAAHLSFLKSITKKGINLKVWPSDILISLKRSWTEVAKDESKRDEMFSRTLKSLKNFQEEFTIWKELSN